MAAIRPSTMRIEPVARMASPGSAVNIPSAFSISISYLPPDLALVPTAERQLGEPDHHGEQADAGERDEEQGGEHARDVEGEAGLQDLVGEAGAAAPGAGDELGDHGADQCKSAGDAQ